MLNLSSPHSGGHSDVLDDAKDQSDVLPRIAGVTLCKEWLLAKPQRFLPRIAWVTLALLYMSDL